MMGMLVALNALMFALLSLIKRAGSVLTLSLAQSIFYQQIPLSFP